ncbi:MAG: hypothetical protein HYT89_04245 [Candidatus Omnitrophica bacterium]|nr:hypothetical protein [Candidatus Omnitrophota bacterium]
MLEPGTVKDASNKIIDGVVKLVPLGLTLYVSNRGVSKGRGERALSSGDLARALRKSFLFGNGFENERRAEDTPDPLIKSYVGNLEGEGIINPAKKLLFYLYEMTDLVMNGVDWITDFKKEETRLILDIMDGPLESQIAWIKSLSSLLPVPEPLRAYIQTLKDYLATDWGIGNNLVQEVMRELDQKGPIEDAIAFVHSGATAPLLKALQQKPYDIQTVLIYEGPYPDYGEKILNPNLERIIHVMGTGSPPEGDAYVPFLGKAEFKGVHPDFETINIEIRGAFHSDFSYNPNDYADHTDWNEEKAERQRINRKVNLFMRDLYEATYKDQTEPGRLKDFFDTLIERNAAEKVNGIWKIDSDNLRDIHLP